VEKKKGIVHRHRGPEKKRGRTDKAEQNRMGKSNEIVKGREKWPKKGKT